MDKMIVYVDDLAYAQQQLAPMVASRRGPDAPAGCWIVVACAPRMTHRISKWVSHSARENWRAKWADKFFGALLPWLTSKGDTAMPVLAQGPLAPLTEKLLGEHPGARVLDMRRPKFGQDLAPVTDAQPQRETTSRWAVPGAVAGMGAMLVLAAE
ncbi:hypothetical protein [Xylophilus sp. GOD-11R]|uniref:hypothetical protein n=1 Tax=Xylophilus sp. GOD-11R TaxID=3089814 RepID=UPI00298CAD8D|nr:hypothetical protein [Xylophilus sp. GOD-11R]WPB56863.1 hypothetical protein R9X41_22460 [Xylophilus sp. GOD-11R]